MLRDNTACEIPLVAQLAFVPICSAIPIAFLTDLKPLLIPIPLPTKDKALIAPIVGISIDNVDATETPLLNHHPESAIFPKPSALGSWCILIFSSTPLRIPCPASVIKLPHSASSPCITSIIDPTSSKYPMPSIVPPTISPTTA